MYLYYTVCWGSEAPKVGARPSESVTVGAPRKEEEHISFPPSIFKGDTDDERERTCGVKKKERRSLAGRTRLFDR